MKKITFQELLRRVEFWGKRLMAAVLAGVILYLIIWIFEGNPKEWNNSKNDIKAIQLKVDSVRGNLDFLTTRQYKIEEGQLKIQQELEENNRLTSEYNKQLLQLKKAYNEKIRSVDNFSINDLDSFFTNRYRKYYK